MLRNEMWRVLTNTLAPWSDQNFIRYLKNSNLGRKIGLLGFMLMASWFKCWTMIVLRFMSTDAVSVQI